MVSSFLPHRREGKEEEREEEHGDSWISCMHDQLVRSKIHYIISQWRLTQDSLSQSISFFWSLYNNMYHGTMPVVHDHLSYATSLEYFHVLFRAWSEQLSNQSMMHAWFTCENARIFCPPLTCIYTAIIVHLRKIYYY